MDFFEHQERARRGTLWLIVCFCLAVVMVILSVYAAAVGIVGFIEAKENEGQIRLWIPELFAAVTASTLVVIVTGSLYKVWQIGSSGEHVAQSLGGREVQANTRDLGERILLNVVEEMALASGTPVPPVYIMDNESGINAFAAGTTPQNAVVGITRGAVDTLSRDQLQGVIAHEFSHILNGDMRLNIRLMGWLHGILVLALIGYTILRALSHGTYGSSSSSKDGKKNEGGFIIVLLLVAAALIIIGYVGVFFAQLIKAAVSRQREYLADASAVQFTRNPDGIAGALIKIGGWHDQSKIKAASAEEASHMFFGSPMLTSLFATHPPLPDRVRRIDPQFDGRFPAVSELTHTGDEIIDPRSLSMARSNRSGQTDGVVSQLTAGAAASAVAGSMRGASEQVASGRPAAATRDLNEAHAVAVAGAQRVAEDPDSVFDSIGHPSIEHIQQIHGLVDQLDPLLARSVRDPLSAVAVVYALLLAPENSDVRAKQNEILATQSDVLVQSEIVRVQKAIDQLVAEQRLPVACLALPALHQMSPAQALEFQNTASALIRSDNRTTLFEFAVGRFIAKRLVARLKPQRIKAISNRGAAEFCAPFALVLSTLAKVGNPSNPMNAFSAGLNALDQVGAGLTNCSLVPAEQLSVPALDAALDQLELAAPKAKRSMLAAFTACISADNQVSVQEGELLRVIADALGSPVPPII